MVRYQLRNFSKTSKRPRRSYDKERLDAELKLIGTYGLKNKREIWRIGLVLSKVRAVARQLLTLEERDPQRVFQGQALMRRMIRYGILDEDKQRLDYALEDEGLEASLHKVLNLEGKHVIETLLVLIEDSVTDHTAHQGLTLEDPLWIPLLEGEQLTSHGPHLGEHKADAPDLTLVLETVGADELELGIETLLVIGTPWTLGCLGEVT